MGDRRRAIIHSRVYLIVVCVLRGAVQGQRRGQHQREPRPDLEIVDVDVDVDIQVRLELTPAPEPRHLVELLAVGIPIDDLEDVLEGYLAAGHRGRHLSLSALSSTRLRLPRVVGRTTFGPLRALCTVCRSSRSPAQFIRRGKVGGRSR